MKKRRIFLSAMCIMFLISAIFFVACDKKTETLEIKLVDVLEWEELIINREYDAITLVETQEKVNYSISEAFYLDSGFKKVAIATQGTKFTQSQPFNVHLTITAQKGNATGFEDVELKINYATNPIIDDMKQSWCDIGVSKTLSAEPKYLTEGNATAIKVRYLGDYNPAGNGVNIGGYGKSFSSYSVTNWNNAVVTFDAFNPMSYDLTLAFFYSLDGVNYTLTYSNLPVTLKANEWTTVAFSLRHFDITTNFLETQGGHMSFKIRVPSSTVTAPYDYNFYICGMDVVDYSSERFPGLETRTADEIEQELIDSMAGDSVDKKMAAYSGSDANYLVEVNNDKEYIKEGDSSVKATFTRTEGIANTTDARGNFLYDSRGKLYSEFEISDWSNVYAGFWIKNTTGYAFDISLRLANTQDGILFRGSEYFKFDSYATNKYINNTTEWTYIEFDIKNLSAISGLFTEGVTGFKVSLSTEIISEFGKPVVFYIDGFNIFNKSGDKIDVKASALADVNYVAEVNSDAAFIKEGNSSIKLTYTKTGDNYRGTFFYDPFGSLMEDFEITDWQRACLGFWIKNETGKNIDLKVAFATSSDGNNYAGAEEFSFGYQPESSRKNISGSEWQYVQFDLYQIYPNIITEGVKSIRFSLSTEIVTATGSFYLDGLSLFSKPAI